MNKVILIGNLARDPEMSQTPNGTSVCKFSLAVNRNFTNANGERECDFINIVVWRELGENCGKYLLKGKKAAVVGSMQTRSYETQDGDKRYTTEVVASDVEFLTPKSDDQQKAPPPPVKKKASELQPVDDDGSLPF